MSITGNSNMNNSLNTNYYLQRFRFFSIILLTACTIALVPFASNAATYYVDAAALNDDGNGSFAAPKKYISSGIFLMSGGDTLILKDGVYTGGKNMVGDYAPEPRRWLPSGTAGQYTVFKAENVGGAIIDAEYSGPAFSNFNTRGADYVRVEGIHFRHGRGGVFNLKGNHNKIIKCGFEDGIPADDNGEAPIAMVAGGSSNTLVEDSWVWGKGRYGLYTNSTDGGAHNVIFRRVVVRLDAVPSWVCAGTRFYNADTNVAQNVIVVDSEPVGCSEYEGAFAMGGGSSSGEPNHSYEGIIALNNLNWPGFMADKSRQVTSIKDAVFWENKGGHGIGTVPTSQGTINIDHVTTGKSFASGFRSNGAYTVTESVSNAISYGNGYASAGVDRRWYGFESIDTVQRVNAFGNANGECSNCSTTNNSLTTNPLVAANGHSSAALKYLVRIEESSNLKGAAIDGGDIGANILKRVGAPESLYADPGALVVTDDNLWPWPDENIWIPKMRAYTATGSGGNRGFAATGQTLTNYVWGYFNYDNDPATPSVIVPPFNVKTYAGDRRIILTWDSPAPIALPAVSGYKVYDVTGLSTPSVPGQGTLVATITGNSTLTATVEGLTNGQRYDYVVTATGSAGESGFAYRVSGVPVSLEIVTPSPAEGLNLNSETSANSIVFAGNAASGSNVEVALNGVTIGSAVADADGHWTLTVSSIDPALFSSSMDVIITAVADGVTSAAVGGLYDVTVPITPTGVTHSVIAH